MESKKKIRVVCAMSGGVDSAVSAAFLVKAGFEVIGVFMKFWAEGVSGGVCLPQNRCCSEESEQRARQTAIQLGIPFYVMDFRNEFKKLIVDGFIADSRKGFTPNPCVVCNQEIKFGLLIKKALEMDAEYVATGHYAQIKKSKTGIYTLLKGKDRSKDQSYFLWGLNQKQLSRIIFPAGDFEKSEIRELAKRLKLPSANTPESQEVCFVSGDISKFLEKYCGTKSGNIVGLDGGILGNHNGLWFYTIGQRKGIGLSGGPYFVVKKNIARNELVITKSLKLVKFESVKLKDVRWINGDKPELPIKIKTKIRYGARETAAVLTHFNGKYALELTKPQFAATPGQSAVFYKNRQILGGGIIAG